MGPQSLSAVTSTITFAVLVFPPFYVTFHSPLLCVSGVITCHLLSHTFFFFYWRNSRIRQYKSPGLISNEEYIIHPALVSSSLLLTLHCLIVIRNYSTSTFSEDS